MKTAEEIEKDFLPEGAFWSVDFPHIFPGEKRREWALTPITYMD
jgi:hypothetical protein